MKSNDKPGTIDSDTRTQKQARALWQEPNLIRMKAGSAEVGANPINNDGAFTTS
ncbi:MAG: hypothetical protein H7Z43_10510 [Clostridia bacterium]|nr:hypothetical protein [Deltaproteobacteria bacterium]